MFNCIYEDNIKKSIMQNIKLEHSLHVIIVVSNPCLYKIRYKLAHEFIERMKKENDIILYIVELAYDDQKFEVTEEGNPTHLQLRANIAPLWHKENMINLGIKKLLPNDWKAVAWIDADIEFDNPHWASDTLKILNGSRDCLQLFTNCIDMNKDKQIMNIFTSFGYQYNKNFIKGQNMNYWHPGFAWAINRKSYDKIGCIFENGILGSSDNIVANCFIKNGLNSLKKGMNQKYLNCVSQYEDKFEDIKLGYVPGIIRHYFHGLKKNRRYYEREDILIKYQYDPLLHMTKDNETGLIIPTKDCPQGLINDIFSYFKERNEDDLQIEEISDKISIFKNEVIKQEEQKNEVIKQGQQKNEVIKQVNKIPQLQIFQNQNNVRKFNSRMVKGLLSR
jgi:hypothetical protein